MAKPDRLVDAERAPVTEPALMRVQRSAGNAAAGELLRRSMAQGDQIVVGSAHDPAERAADAMGDRVSEYLSANHAGRPLPDGHAHAMRAADSVSRAGGSSAANGAIGDDGGVLDEATTTLLKREMNSGGSSLSDQVRQPMEQAFGHSFENVRVHSGATAQELSRSMSAAAFTVGSNVFLGANAPSASSKAGQHLLAHELTHVVQGQVGEDRAHRMVIRRKGDVRNFLSSTKAKAVKTVTGAKGAKGGKTVDDAIDNAQPVSKALRAHIQTRHAEAELDFLRAYDAIFTGAGAEIPWNTVDALLTRFNGQVTGLNYAPMSDLNDAIRSKKLFGSDTGPSRTAGIKSVLSGVVDGAKGRLRAAIDSYNTSHARAAAAGPAAAQTDAGAFGAKGVAPTQFTTANLDATAPPTQLGKGSVNTVWEHTYTGVAAQQVFKADSEVNEFYGRDAGTQVGIPEHSPQFAQRSVAMYELDQALGINIIPPTAFAAQNGEFGTVMEKAQGKAAFDIANGKTSVTATEWAAIKADPAFQSSLMKLQLLDIIAGQLDRHNGNYYIDFDPVTKQFRALSGIDNDMAFGADHNDITQEVGKGWNDLGGGVRSNKAPTAGKMGGSTSVEMISLVDPVFITNVLAIAPITVQNALANLLSPQEIAATVKRLLQLQLYLRDVLDQRVSKELANMRTGNVSVADAAAGVGPLRAQYLLAKNGGQLQQAYDMLVDLRERVNRLELAVASGANAAQGAVNVGAVDLAWLTAEMNDLSRQLHRPVAKPTVTANALTVTHADSAAAASVLWATLADDPKGRVQAAGGSVDTAMRRLWSNGDQALRTQIASALGPARDQLRMSHIGYLLEVLDPAHSPALPTSFGTWDASGSNQDFFAWLALNPIGPGTPKAKYYTANEKEDARIRFTGGKLQRVDGAGTKKLSTPDGGWIVVMDTAGEFYSKAKGAAPGETANTQHSSFLTGMPVEAAGMLKARDGTLTFVNNHSGHYAPSTRHLSKLVDGFASRGVSMKNVNIEDKDALRQSFVGAPAFHAAAAAHV
jgi:hypothetical protein